MCVDLILEASNILILSYVHKAFRGMMVDYIAVIAHGRFLQEGKRACTIVGYKARHVIIT